MKYDLIFKYESLNGSRRPFSYPGPIVHMKTMLLKSYVCVSCIRNNTQYIQFTLPKNDFHEKRKKKIGKIKKNN